MGLRFRRSVSLGRLVRLNFSGSGVSLGLGPRGLNVNIGPKGVRKTVGIPGSGLSYQTFSSWKKDEASLANAPSLPAASSTDGPRPSYGTLLLLAGLLIAAFYGLSHCESTPQSSTTVAPAIAPAKAPSSVTAVTPAKEPTPTASAIQPEASRSIASPKGPLGQEEILEIQTWLKAFGLDPGPLDGIVGPKTLEAAQRYAAARGLPIPEIGRDLLDRLRSDAGHSIP